MIKGKISSLFQHVFHVLRIHINWRLVVGLALGMKLLFLGKPDNVHLSCSLGKCTFSHVRANTQTSLHMCRLVWVYTELTCEKVHVPMHWLVWVFTELTVRRYIFLSLSSHVRRYSFLSLSSHVRRYIFLSLSSHVRRYIFLSLSSHVRRYIFLGCSSNDQNLCCPHEETLYSLLSKMHSVKILIRLHKCTGWSEPLLGAHVQRYIFPRG